MKRDARTVASWNFDRIIPCHGVSVHPCLGNLTLIYILYRMLLKQSVKMHGQKHINGI